MWGAIIVENMTHFTSECPNTLTVQETDYEDADPASLQMMSHNFSTID